MNYQGFPWTLDNSTVLHKKKHEKDGERIPGQARISNCQGLSVAEPITAPAKAPAGRRDQQAQSQNCWVQGTVTYAR